MPRLFVLTSLILLFSSIILKGNNYFYYSPKGQEPLVLSHTKILIQFTEGTTLAKQQEILTEYKFVAPLQISNLLPSPQVTFANLVDVESDEQVLNLLKSLRLYPQIKFAYPVFNYRDGTQMGLQAKLLIRLKNANHYPVLEQVALQHNLVITKENDFDELLFHVAIRDANLDPLNLAQELFTTKLFDYVEPDFLRFLQPMSTNDPALGSQWAIENTGQNSGTPGIAGADMRVIEAWRTTTGKPSVKIAIVDEGVDLNHPDLIGNIVAGYDATEQNSGGAPSGNDAHGTACAGIAAAVGNNNLGMVGVAYDSQIIPVRLAYSDGENWVTSSAWVSNAINWSWQEGAADVISNSWGGGGSSFSINNAIDNAVRLGRNGLGTPILFATGNENTEVSYPADYAPGIAVGAMSMCYERKTPNSCDNETWWGSNYGTHLDVVAPGTRIHATDISGTAGYSSSDYATYFNGTSAATPNAAGVLALILSANENLTEQQARYALESTCRKVGDYNYADGVVGQPTGSWNNEMGYGLVDAAAAIQAVAPSRENDAGIMEIISPTATICGTEIQPVVRLRNNGSNALQSAKIHTRISGGEIRIHQWSGNLASTETTEVNLPTIPASAAAHTLEIYTSEPNGKVDANADNDRAFTTFSIGQEEFELNVVLDNYGSETSWDIKNDNQEILLSSEPYSDNAVGQQIEEKFCLPAGCYTLTFYDEYDDGMCCGYGDGSYELTQISSGAVLATGGQYTDQIIHEFCFETPTEQEEEPTPDPLVAEITNVTHVRCFAENSGSARVNVSGGTLPYTYQWSNGSTQASANNLATGNQQVTIKDAANQSITKEIFIEEPTALQLTMAVQNAVDNENGIASVEVNGGVSPYIYQWSNGGRSATIDGLSSGIYTVTVIDQNDCTKVESVTVGNDETPALEVIISNIRSVNCHGNTDGSATAQVSGGFPPYIYQWSDGNTTTLTNSLTAGLQSITVTDSREQSVVKTFSVEQPTAIEIKLTTQNAVDNEDGIASVEVSGGVSPYIYQWSNGGRSATIDGLSSGTYTITVTDQNDCSKIGNVTVGDDETPALQVLITNIHSVNCHGNADGSATAQVSGGFPPYIYQWSDGSTSTSARNLMAGSQSVTVTDDKEQSVVKTFSIEQPTAIRVVTTSQSALDNQNGSATASADGGVAPYIYQWSNGGSTATIEDLSSGIYVVTVTDQNDCSQTQSVMVDNEETPDLIVTITEMQAINCYGNENGKAQAQVTGGVAPYTFLWSNGSTATEVNDLPEGTFYVAVRDGEGRAARAEAYMESPTELVLETNSQIAVDNQGGSANVLASGGTSPYRYNWSNGKTFSHIYDLTSGDYTVTVTDRNGCSQTATVTVANENTPDPEPELTPDILFEYGQITGLDNNWQTVELKNTYESMVVVATVRLPNVDAAPVVTRIKNVDGNQFDIRLQNPADDSFTAMTVDYFVVEEGIYNENDHGIKMEAVKNSSTVTASRNDWVRERRVYENSYTDPVVLGQVMTYNDERWSVFWASATSRRNAAPSAREFAAGKHVGEDDNNEREDETIGYVVFESGIQQINDTKFYTALGADQVRGVSNTTNGYTYNINGLAAANIGVLSAAGMDSNNGGWPVFLGENAVSGDNIRLVFDEDQQRDAERAHTSEQVAFIVFEDNEIIETEEIKPLVVEYGQLSTVNQQWKRVELDNTYESMVVVATVVMDNQEQLPAVTRISEAIGNSFLIKIQNPAGQNGGNYQVQYFVVEEGVYNEFDHGVTMEAVKTISTKTSARRDWAFESRSYQNNYTEPVVVGQVMTYNDEGWSMFWASNGNRKRVPTATNLSIGKHVGEDPVKERADETLGYVVFEAGTGEINGINFSAGVGEDRVYGMYNTRSGYRYEVAGVTDNSTAILSSAAMDGSDCGWPVLYGNTAVDTDQLIIVIDEDIINDEERAHPSEQVAYVVFDIENTTGFTANNGGNMNPDSTDTEYAEELVASLKTYPNPTIDWITVESNQILIEATTVRIYDALGRLAYQQVIEIDPKDKQEFRLNTTNLPGGQYSVHVQNEHQTFTTSFIKQ